MQLVSIKLLFFEKKFFLITYILIQITSMTTFWIENRLHLVVGNETGTINFYILHEISGRFTSNLLSSTSLTSKLNFLFIYIFIHFIDNDLFILI